MHPIPGEAVDRCIVRVRHRVARREGTHFNADILDGFHFRGDPGVAVGIAAVVQGDDSNRVTSHQPFARGGFVKDKRIHPLQMVHEVCPVKCIQWKDDLAVRCRGEGGVFECAALQVPVVVDFSIHGQQVAVVGVLQGLGAAGDIHNGQALVCQNGVGGLNDT